MLVLFSIICGHSPIQNAPSSGALQQPSDPHTNLMTGAPQEVPAAVRPVPELPQLLLLGPLRPFRAPPSCSLPRERPGTRMRHQVSNGLLPTEEPGTSPVVGVRPGNIV